MSSSSSCGVESFPATAERCVRLVVTMRMNRQMVKHVPCTSCTPSSMIPLCARNPKTPTNRAFQSIPFQLNRQLFRL